MDNGSDGFLIRIRELRTKAATLTGNDYYMTVQALDGLAARSDLSPAAMAEALVPIEARLAGGESVAEAPPPVPAAGTPDIPPPPATPAEPDLVPTPEVPEVPSSPAEPDVGPEPEIPPAPDSPTQPDAPSAPEVSQQAEPEAA
jgi:hypothetical protein